MTDRPLINIRAEMERLAEERRRSLGGVPVSHERGIPLRVAPASGVGGDIVENRREQQ